MMFSWTNQTKPIVALSPMADMTDSPFCQIVKSLAEPIVFHEMVSAEAMVRDNEKTRRMADFESVERPVIQQIFGAEPAVMARAASLIERDFAPDGIDINMGCPAYKITANFNGAALMKEPELAARIVREVREAISLPLSVKMRAGWSDPSECARFAPLMEAAGADLLSIHGRTKTQAYAGRADRGAVAAAKRAVSIPVLYNGDITTADDFISALEETGCDGALIGRGALGNPWLFAQIEAKLRGEQIKPIILEERLRVVREHLDLHLKHHGPASLVTFRKHIAWYFKGLPGFKRFKAQLMTETNPEAFDVLLDQIKKQGFSA